MKMYNLIKRLLFIFLIIHSAVSNAQIPDGKTGLPGEEKRFKWYYLKDDYFGFGYYDYGAFYDSLGTIVKLGGSEIDMIFESKLKWTDSTLFIEKDYMTIPCDCYCKLDPTGRIVSISPVGYQFYYNDKGRLLKLVTKGGVHIIEWQDDKILYITESDSSGKEVRRVDFVYNGKKNKGIVPCIYHERINGLFEPFIMMPERIGLCSSYLPLKEICTYPDGKNVSTFFKYRFDEDGYIYWLKQEGKKEKKEMKFEWKYPSSSPNVPNFLP